MRARGRAFWWAAALAVAALAAVGGCQREGLTLATVKGTVRYRGKPLDHGNVVFTATEGTKGPQGVGAIQPDGSFTIQTAGRPGAVVGKHLVTIDCRRVVTPAEAKNLVVGELLIPAKYAREEETDLRFEVRPGENEYPIDLQ